MQTGSTTTSRTDDLLSIGRTVVAVARQEQITLMAASLAYYLFTALVPLLLFSVIALSLFGHGVLSQLSGTASGTVLPSGVSVPKTLLANTQGRFRAAVLGAVILAWSALRTFGALDGAFAAVYDEREEVSPVDKAIDAVIVFVTVGLATVALALVGGALALAVKDRLLLRVASPLFLFVTLAIVFAPLYYLLPEVEGVTLAEILPGTLLAALVWTVSAVVVRLYATTSSSVQFYGVAGGLLLLLTWLYVGGLALLVGAALNATLADRIDPDAEWLPTAHR
ncbi:YihY/virulence factor BrkB family protein [Halococcus thailandensis]|uniref:Ribonuclease BN n=1 Tax=Halococcus thailandensis JCM 13552 TaxID=1227457 RepID=M0NC04_9EURY|nr:YhjD/YihY/BrkB family envelope integrity protein [Halococcus thailandensis]EMA54205.1 ribonuclease BN [Halococcus thailandensis JCM 13552]